MRDFPKIDQEADTDALQTLFFKDGEFGGRQVRVCRVDYLAFLSLRDPEIHTEIKILHTLQAQHPPEDMNRDIDRLLTSSNWRVHNIACVSLAAGFGSDESIAALWRRIHDGSWTSPQLSATAAYVDLAFETKALKALADHRTYFKSIVALAAILHAEFGIAPTEETGALENVVEASSMDNDNSGEIGLRWLSNLRKTFGLPRFLSGLSTAAADR